MCAFHLDPRAAPCIALNWIWANPGQTALVVASGAVCVCPAALTARLLAAVGFGAQGPVAGTAATWLQLKIGDVVARSGFAYVQSTPMGGYGEAAVEGVARGAAVVAGAAGWVASRLGGNSTAELG